MRYSSSRIKDAVFFIVGVLGFVSSAVFVICFALPFACLLVLGLMLQSGSRERRRAARVAMIFLVSQIVGFAISKIVIFNSPLDGRIPISIDSAKASVFQLIQATKYIFDPSTPFAFAMASVFFLFFAFSVFKSVVIIIALFRKEQLSAGDQSIKLICIFFVLSVFCSVAGSVFSGGFMDNFGYRYFEVFIALSLLIGILVVDGGLGQRYKDVAIGFIALGCFSVTVISIFFLESSRSKSIGDLVSRGAFNEQEAATAQCIDDLVANGLPLKAGISDYWLSRGVMFFSKSKIFISQSSQALEPFFWISSIAPILRPGNYGASHYNFVISNNSEIGGLTGFNTEAISRLIPEGYELFSCKKSSSHIFYYSSGDLNACLKKVHESFLFSMRGIGAASYTGSQLPGLIGKVNGRSRMAGAGDGAGILTFGPYVTLPKGKYLAVLDFELDERVQGGSRVQVGRFDSNVATILASKALPVGAHKLEVPFEVESSSLERVEVRTKFGGNGSLLVNGLVITREK